MHDPSDSEKKLEAEAAALRARVEELERARSVDFEIHDTLHRHEEIERLFGERVTALVEITNELSLTADVDALCRRAVELARDKLGFDCIGIWFREKDSDVVVGSYGVDARGKVVDERHKRTQLDLSSPDGQVLLARKPLVLAGDVPIVDEHGNVTGKGSQVFAAIWDGENVIGHISMDYRIRQRPITWHACEVLRLFGSGIGSLVARKKAEEKQEKLIAELQGALDRIKTLDGLLPICASCKKIRDDKGYWQQIEAYIADRSDAEFSHGLCPDCAKELYPELYEKYVEEKARRAKRKKD